MGRKQMFFGSQKELEQFGEEVVKTTFTSNRSARILIKQVRKLTETKSNFTNTSAYLALLDLEDRLVKLHDGNFSEVVKRF